MAHHDLKSIETYFFDVWNGHKTFEFRKNDRGFQVGDTVTLRPIVDAFANTVSDTHEITATISYILYPNPPVAPLPSNYIIFGMIDIVRVLRQPPAKPKSVIGYHSNFA